MMNLPRRAPGNFGLKIARNIYAWFRKEIKKMSKKLQPRGPNKRCTVITIRNGILAEAKVPKHLVSKLKGSVDFYENKLTGEICYKTPSGEPKEYPDGVPDFGPEMWDFLEEIILAHGDYVALPSENWAATRVCRLRSICGDSFELQYFFKTRRSPGYGVRIRTERSWMFVKS